MCFDRFDICEAHYLFLSAYHGGQDCPMYARLSRLLTWFSPRDGPYGTADLSDNGQEIYNRLAGLEARDELAY